MTLLASGGSVHLRCAAKLVVPCTPPSCILTRGGHGTRCAMRGANAEHSSRTKCRDDASSSRLQLEDISFGLDSRPA